MEYFRLIVENGFLQVGVNQWLDSSAIVSNKGEQAK
jgi:hypothetical protein